MRRSRRSAFTLVETLVVIAIIALLSGTLWMVLAPRAHRAAQVADVRSRLRQCALAINFYMNDHDGEPPITLNHLVPGLSIVDPIGGGNFDYPLSTGTFERSHIHILEYGFDPSRDAVVKCGTINDWHGETQTTMTSDGNGHQWPYEVPILGLKDTMHVLGARLDGSVGWVNSIDSWEENLPPIQPPPAR